MLSFQLIRACNYNNVYRQPTHRKKREKYPFSGPDDLIGLYYKSHTLKTLKYKYPLASAMDRVRECLRSCRLLLTGPGSDSLIINNELNIQYLRTVNDMKIAGYIDEGIGNDWFI